MPATVLSATPTLDTAAYATGDCMGTKMTFLSAARPAFQSGRVVAVSIVDLGGQSAALDVVLFSDNPTGTTFTDNNAIAIADADFSKIITTITFAASDYKVLASSKSFGRVILAAPVPFVLAGTTMYAILVSRGSPDYVTAADVVVKLHLERD